MIIKYDNSPKFNAVRALHLPLGHYVITGSGPIGVRGIRPMGDVDLIVTDRLWSRLRRRYAVCTRRGFCRIALDPIEIMGPCSILAPRTGYPTLTDQIADSELIQGLPFISLRHSLHFKSRVLNRPKDQADIVAIRRLLRLSTSQVSISF